ncbi:MAG TPA: DUF418 domain-containing protein [Methylomirabilota bacterium]|nr:DUF418 domain-containing protein [Methylomirabilota bacterium]
MPSLPTLPARSSSSEERIESVDVVRGFAVFGILAANILAFALVPDLRWWTDLPNRLAERFVETFIASKFIILFSTLFGLSFALQMLREESRGGPFVRLFIRRQVLLLAIGLVHALALSAEDILVFYAVMGVALLPFRHSRPRTILSWAVALYLLSFVSVEVGVIRTLPENQAPTASSADTGAGDDMTLVARTYRYGTFSEIAARRVRDYVAHNPAVTPLEYPRKFAFFLVGLFIARCGILHELQAYRRVMLRLAVVALGVGSSGVVLLFLCHLATAPAWARVFTVPLYAVTNPALSLFYATAVVLLFGRPRSRRWLYPLCMVGRMALTNYVAQSIVCTYLFYGYGLRLYGRLGPLTLLGISVLIFAAQIGMSAVWQARFRLGPIEWLWRSATRGVLVPMRLSSSAVSRPASPASPDGP